MAVSPAVGAALEIPALGIGGVASDTPLLPASGFSIFNLTHMAPRSMLLGVVYAPVFNMVIQTDGRSDASSLKSAPTTPAVGSSAFSKITNRSKGEFT